jgi:hypothetical protein
MANLPNGYSEQKEDKKIEKVVEGDVVKKRKSTGDKILSTFIAQDLKTVGNSVWTEIVVPGIKDTLSRIVSNGIDMLLFGESRTPSRSAPSGSYVSYASYYSKGQRNDNYRNHVIDRRDLDEDITLTLQDAKKVLRTLEDIIDKYGQASVADYYDALGITSNFTDYKYGWTSVRSARIVPKGGRYMIDLPIATLLD